MTQAEQVSWPTRLVAYSVVWLMLVQTSFVAAQSATLANSAGGSHTLVAPNNVPIVNIAKPNDKGVSHNQYQKFNIDKQGLILNNAKAPTATQLAGFINANPNLHNNPAATLIINEVIGANRSMLQGYAEIAGQQAGLVIANPYGISCNGCGFINTPRLTLSTGTPNFNNGNLTGFTVNGGSVVIQGLGLNANNVSQFDIISRSLELNANLYAQNLNIVLGRNEVGYTDLSATALAAGGGTPLFALDSSAIGGMYANAIRLIGTEAGVGVRALGDVASHTGQLQLSADGKIQLQQVYAKQLAQINSISAGIELNNEVRSDGDLSLSAAGQLSNKSLVTAANNISISSQTLEQQGTIAAAINGEYQISGNGQLAITNSGQINNRGRLISGGGTQLSFGNLANQNNGSIHSGVKLNLFGNDISNVGAIYAQGNVLAQLTGNLRNSGEIQTAANLMLTANSLNNGLGTISAAGQVFELSLVGGLNNSAGLISTQAADSRISASQIINQQGRIEHGDNGSLTISSTATGIDNRAGRIQSNNSLRLSQTENQTLDNSLGILAADQLSLEAGAIKNSSGVIEAQTLAIKAKSLVNDQHQGSEQTASISALSSAENGLVIELSGDIVNAAVLQSNTAGAVVKAKNITNSGDIIHLGKGRLQLSATQNNRNSGLIIGTGELDLSQAELDNRQGEIISQKATLAGGGSSAANLTINSRAGLNNSAGLIRSEGGLQIKAASLNNQGGEITGLSAQQQSLNIAAALDNQQGLIQTNATEFSVAAASLNNAQGKITHASSGEWTLLLSNASGVLNNTQGQLQGNGRLTIRAGRSADNAGQTINNQQGLIVASHIDSKSASLDNRGGIIESQTLYLDIAGNLHNSSVIVDDESKGGLIAALSSLVDSMQLKVSELIDNQGSLQSNAEDLALNAKTINNQGKIIHAGQGQLSLAASKNLTNAGEISSAGKISISGSNLNNQGGKLYNSNNQSITIDVAGLVNNTEALIESAGALNLKAASLNNDKGKISALGQAASTITLAGDLNNGRGGLVQSNADIFTVTVMSLANQGGTILHAGEQQLLIASQGVLNNDTGKILANNKLQLLAGNSALKQNLNNRDGSIQANQLSLDALELNNQGGTIEANKLAIKTQADVNNGRSDSDQLGLISALGSAVDSLVLAISGKLNNNAGTLQTNAESLDLATTEINNSGSIIHAGSGHLIIGSAEQNIQQLNNQGSIKTNGRLELYANNVDNSGGKLISEKGQRLSVSQQLNNNNGLIESIAELDVQAKSLSNQAGKIKALGTSNSQLHITASLDNSAGGKIQSNAASLSIVAGTLNNAGGEIEHAGDSALSLISKSGGINNDAGSIKTNASLVAQSGAANKQLLSNKAGVITAAGLTLQSGQLNNQGGIIEANSAEIITQGDLNNGLGANNKSGIINIIATALDSLKLTVSQLLNNGDGTVKSNSETYSISAGSIKNAGIIGHAGSGTLNLKTDGELNNQNGEILSLGSINLGGTSNTGLASLNNQGGSILAGAALSLNSTGLIANQAGALESKTGFMLNALSLDNSNGRLVSESGGADALTLSAGFINADGLLSVKSNVFSLNAASLNNHDGVIIHANSNGRLNLNIARIDNTRSASKSEDFGLIVSTGSAYFSAFNQMNNSGYIQAGHLEFTSSQGNISNLATGRLIATGPNSLVITAKDFDNDNGTVHSYGALTATVQNLNNQGVFQSQGNTVVSLNSLSGEGVINSGQDLDFSYLGGDYIHDIDRVFTAGGNLSINNQGYSFTNYGHISSGGNINVRAKNLYNGYDDIESIENGELTAGANLSILLDGVFNNVAGSILSAGADINLKASTIENGGVIASGGNATLTANSIDNRNTIFSAGELDSFTTTSFTNNTGANVYALGDISFYGQDENSKSASLLNSSGVIESYAGTVAINTLWLKNTRTEYEVSDQGVVVQDSGAAKILAGKDIRIGADKIENVISLIAANKNIDLIGISLINQSASSGGTGGWSDELLQQGAIEVETTGEIHLTAGSGPFVDAIREAMDRGEIKNQILIRKRSLLNVCYQRSTNGGCLEPDILYSYSLYKITPTQLLEVHSSSSHSETNPSDIDYANLENGNFEAVTDISSLYTGNSSIVDSNETQLYFPTGNFEARSGAPATIAAGGTFTGSFSGQIDNVNIRQNVTASNTVERSEDTAATGPEQVTVTARNKFSVGLKANSAAVSTASQNSLGGSSRSSGLPGVLVGQQFGLIERKSSGTTAASVNQSQGALADNANGDSAPGPFTGHVGDITLADYNPVDFLQLPNSPGLFQINKNPNHHYLVETNPAFSQYTNFIGSDYFLKQMGINPETSVKRLGDAFYETRLIQDAVFQTTGQRYLAANSSGLRFNNDQDQMRYLMDNGIAAAQRLNLAVGIALSAEQVAALTHDTLWMVEQEVQGQKVLVPVYYSPSVRNGDLAVSGALLQGADVQLVAAELNNQTNINADNSLTIDVEGGLNNQGKLSAGSLLSAIAAKISNALGGIIRTDDSGSATLIARSGDINNRGKIQAGNLELIARAGSINNIGSEIKASGDINAEAGNDLLNKNSGRRIASISAGNNANINAIQGSVINNAEVQIQGTGANQSIRTGAAPIIKAGGNLNLSAGKNIENKAGSLGAGGSLVARAANNIDISAAKTSTKTQDGSNSSEHTQYAINEIKAGAELVLEAGGELNLTGVAATAGGGVLLKGDNINITAVENKNHSQTSAKRKKNTTTTIRNAKTSIAANDGLRIVAGTDLNIKGGDLKAGGDIALAAGGDTVIESVKDSDYSYSYKKKKKSFGRSKTYTSESYDSRNVASTVTAGGNLTVNSQLSEDGSIGLTASEDVAIVGSELSAGGELIVAAGDDVEILSGVEEHGAYSKKKKSGLLGISKKSKSQLQTKASQVASTLNAGGNAAVISGDDMSFRASEVNSEGNVNLQAGVRDASGSITLSAGTDTEYSKTETQKKKIGVSLSSKSISFASASKAGQEALSSKSVGSKVDASQNANLLAKEDVNIIGSTVKAGGDVNISAGRNVNISDVTVANSDKTWNSKSKSGLSWDADRNSVSVFAGKKTNKLTNTTSQDDLGRAQLLASNNVNVSAAETITQVGGDVVAGQDIVYLAKDIDIQAAQQASSEGQINESRASGLGVKLQHNVGNTIDALKNVGKGEDGVSKGSSVLAAVDAVSSFVSGPSASAHLGSTRSKTETIQTNSQAVGASLSAGRDIHLQASNNLTAAAIKASAARDINLIAENVAVEAAIQHQQFISKTVSASDGIVLRGGGNQASIGGQHTRATSDYTSDGTQAAVAQLQAGRDINAAAGSDLSLVGIQAQAGRDINLQAGNNLIITAADNSQQSDLDENSFNTGGGIAISVGSGGAAIGGYAEIGFSKNDLAREGNQKTNAKLLAGESLNIKTGQDATIAGANLEAKDISLDVGRNLTVASLQDTGKVDGQRMDANISATVGIGFSISGSVGYGETEGKKAWVNEQTSIVGSNSVDINVGKHTQIDGAVIANIDKEGKDQGKLTLNTNSLAYTDLKDTNKEKSFYLNVSGGYSNQKSSGTNSAGSEGLANQPGVKGEGAKANGSGSASWGVKGNYSSTNQQQDTNATLGQGDIAVRSGDESSPSSINRDVDQGQVLTKDKSKETNLYVTSSSIDAVKGMVITDDPNTPEDESKNNTFMKWKADLENYSVKTTKIFENMGKVSETLGAQENVFVKVAGAVAGGMQDAMDKLGYATAGLFPSIENHGGVVTQLPALVFGDQQNRVAEIVLKINDNGKYEIDWSQSTIGSGNIDITALPKDIQYAFINGIQNALIDAARNAAMQTSSKKVLLAYNPQHGFLGDLIESGWDTTIGKALPSGNARQVAELLIEAQKQNIPLKGAAHSQGGLLLMTALNWLDKGLIERDRDSGVFMFQINGAPVKTSEFIDAVGNAGGVIPKNGGESAAHNINAGDPVPLVLGRNAEDASQAWDAILNVLKLFDSDVSPHSSYVCTGEFCANEQEGVEGQP